MGFWYLRLKSRVMLVAPPPPNRWRAGQSPPQVRGGVTEFLVEIASSALDRQKNVPSAKTPPRNCPTRHPLLGLTRHPLLIFKEGDWGWSEDRGRSWACGRPVLLRALHNLYLFFSETVEFIHKLIDLFIRRIDWALDERLFPVRSSLPSVPIPQS